MEVLNLDTISATLRKVKIDGFSLMTKELGSLIHMILNMTALEENIGEERVKVHISWSMKKSKNHLFDFNSILQNSKKKLLRNLT